MKKIYINLDDDRTIDHAIDEIDKLMDLVESFPGAIAEKEADIAKWGFANADANDKDITVRTEKQPKKGRIIAEGESVGFAEYGTGLSAEQDGEAPIPTGFGTWSLSENGKGNLENHTYWFYKGIPYYEGTPATHAMRDTVQHIKQNVNKMAQEHFK